MIIAISGCVEKNNTQQTPTPVVTPTPVHNQPLPEQIPTPNSVPVENLSTHPMIPVKVNQ